MSINVRKAILEDRAVMNCAGSAFPSAPLKRETAKARQIRDNFFSPGEETVLEYPADTRKYIPRPASSEEAGLFYALPQARQAPDTPVQGIAMGEI